MKHTIDLPKPGAIAYAGHDLDRAVDRRADVAWLAAARTNTQSVVLPVWRENNLIDAGFDKGGTEPDGDPRPMPVTGDAGVALMRAHDPILLGIVSGRAHFACDLSGLDLDAARDAVGDNSGESSFIDLRRVGPLLSHAEGAMLAYARGMTYWQRRHRFCGECGQPTTSESAGHARHCSDADCGAVHFPRSDPAVIMLVTDDGPNGPRCLLGRQATWPEGRYSSLAGFVEPGESLEGAVAREVLEEACIHITDIRYRASQPWPFPSSLMLGFRARAVTTEIDTTEDELEDARWFDKSEIESLYRSGESDGRLSRPDSIARRLIEDWLIDPS